MMSDECLRAWLSMRRPIVGSGAAEHSYECVIDEWSDIEVRYVGEANALIRSRSRSISVHSRGHNIR